MPTSKARQFECLLCKKGFVIEQLYSLDACSHKYCRPCLSSYVHRELLDKLCADVTCPTFVATVSYNVMIDIFITEMVAEFPYYRE